ncbi:MAG: DUF3108 domain-containing protein [Luteolibacter sp.]
MPAFRSRIAMNFRSGLTVPSRMSTCARLLCLSLLALPFLQAAPAWKSELTSPAPGPFPQISPTVLDLSVSWNGTIKAGTVRVEFAPPDVRKPGNFVVRSTAASQGAAAVLFPYQTNFWSEMDSSTLLPQLFHASETDDEEKVDTTVRYFPTRVESREINQLLKTGKITQTDRSFHFAPVFDIFSAMLHVRSQKLDAGDKMTLVVRPFGTSYLLKVHVVGRERHQGRDAIRLSVGMRKIDRKSLELLPYKKLKRDATFWLSDDAERIPLEMRAAVFIGDVRATLTSHRKL